MAPDNTKKKLSTAEKTIKAVEMKKAGNSYQEIGDELGCSREYAYKLVKNELKRLMEEVDESCLEYREIENQRLDSLWTKAYAKVKDGDLSAVNTCIKISERRSKLYGLDGPQKLEHTGEMNVNVSDVRERITSRISSISSRSGKKSDSE